MGNYPITRKISHSRPGWEEGSVMSVQSSVESRYVVPSYLLKVSQSRTGQDLPRLNKTLQDREALK
jgi:hypothetical protein